MKKTDNFDNLRKLIDVGKDRGYVTYDDINEELPDEFLSSEESIDDLLLMFEDLDISITDETVKDDEKVEDSEVVAVDDLDVLRVDAVDTSSKGYDPVKMYLKEMGCISLLTREGEVEIAKRIEEG
ncbi:MAG: RNA polymerase sigma factor region1.1 domain-containing protein, partial [Desulfatiglandales bacterium]